MLPGSKSSDVADAETIGGGGKPVRPAGPLRRQSSGGVELKIRNSQVVKSCGVSNVVLWMSLE